MDLTGKNVLIFVGPDFEDRELFYPLYRLREAGATVVIAGIGDKTYKGKYGVPIEVTGQCEDYAGKKYDAIIVPGGWAPDKIRMNNAALDIVRKTAKDGGVVAAICHGGWVLASADVVDGRTVTSYLAVEDDMVHAGAHWIDKEVVVDGNIITSRKPDDLPAFCKEIIRVMQLAKVGV